MIVWINGTFGVGKTTTAALLAEQTSWRVFDPEHVGYLLAGNLRDLQFVDFQELPPWRTLVPAVADEIYRYTESAAMIAVQTVLEQTYWHELAAGFSARNLDVFHVVLDCDNSELRRRIETDGVEAQAAQWRLDHIEAFEAARPWLSDAADLVLDTTDLTPSEVASRIIAAAQAKRRTT